MRVFKKVDKVSEVAYFINKKKFKNILIVTGVNSFKYFNYKNSFLDEIGNKSYFIFYNKSHLYNEYKNLIVLIKLINKYNPDVILAIGGGTVIDLAKLANALCFHKNIKKKILNNRIQFDLKKKCDLIAIPTTAGSGSEVTKFSVLYVNGKKYSIENSIIIPDFFFLIPSILRHVPIKIRVTSGFDSIVQSIESLFSRESNKNSVRYSLISIRYSFKSFLAYALGSNRKIDFSNVLLASHYSGKAINIAKTNGPHAFSYFFTTNFGIAHGNAVVLFFLNFIKFYYANINNCNVDFNLKSRFNLLMKTTRTKNILDFIKYFNSLIIKTKINVNLKTFRIDIDKEFNHFLKYLNIERLNNCPISLSIKDIKNIVLN
jgi:alcohol dehydrogenase class IV